MENQQAAISWLLIKGKPQSKYVEDNNKQKIPRIGKAHKGNIKALKRISKTKKGQNLNPYFGKPKFHHNRIVANSKMPQI